MHALPLPVMPTRAVVHVCSLASGPVCMHSAHARALSQCFVDAHDRSLVYLDIAEPLSFYFDLVLIGIMLAIALSFAACLVMQHRATLARIFSALWRMFVPPKEGAPGSAPASGEAGGRPSSQLRAPLTPGTIKSAYRHVVKGFHEMV